jgi:hypothetical protein
VCVFRVYAEEPQDQVQGVLALLLPGLGATVALKRFGEHAPQVETNAQQYNLTGCAVMTDQHNIVVVEGGPKNIRKYKRLMLNRIQWNEKRKCVCVCVGGGGGAGPWLCCFPAWLSPRLAQQPGPVGGECRAGRRRAVCCPRG